MSVTLLFLSSYWLGYNVFLTDFLLVEGFYFTYFFIVQIWHYWGPAEAGNTD